MNGSRSPISGIPVVVALLAVLFTTDGAHAQAVPALKAAEVWRIDGKEAGESFANVYAADGKSIRQISRSAGGYGYRWDGWFNRTSGELSERPIGGVIPIWQRYTAQGVKLGS